MVEKPRRYRKPPLNYGIAACLDRSRFVLGLDLWYPAIAFLESKDQFPKIAFQGSDDDQAIFTKSWFSQAYISLATRSLKNDTILRKLFLNGAKRAASLRSPSARLHLPCTTTSTSLPASHPPSQIATPQHHVDTNNRQLIR
jgi:hypothetical protein